MEVNKVKIGITPHARICRSPGPRENEKRKNGGKRPTLLRSSIEAGEM